MGRVLRSIQNSRNVRNDKFLRAGNWSLFDLANDPLEDQTIADAKPEVVERMAKQFEQWWAQFGFDCIEVSKDAKRHFIPESATVFLRGMFRLAGAFAEPEGE